MKPIVSFTEFDKLDLRVGRVTACERKEGSEKLLRLTVDFGDEGIRNILSGIAPYYHAEDLVGRSFVFVINLEPKALMDEQSEGMILAADGSKPLPLQPIEEAEPGTQIR